MKPLTTQNTNSITRVQILSDELYQNWIKYIDVKDQTRSTYERAIKQFRVWLSAGNITQPVRADILAYRDYLKANYKASTVQAYIIAVRLFFKYLEQMGLYPDIADKVKGAKVTAEHKEDYLSIRQSQNLLRGIDRNTLQGKRDYAIVCCMLTGGLRTIEVIRANTEDLSILNDTPVMYLQGKGKDERTAFIKLEENTAQAVAEYMTARGTVKEGEPLFCSVSNKNAGGRLTTRSISRLVKTHLTNSGLNSPRITAHSLRHTTAVINLRNGATLEETQQIMRHSNIATTMIYLNTLSREKNNSEARIGQAIFNTI